MDLLIKINIYIFPVLIFTIILMSIYRNSIQTTETNIFKKIIIFELATLVLELISWVYDGTDKSIELSILWASNLLYFVVAPLAPYYWMNFASYIVYEHTVNEYKKVTKLICIAPILVYLFLVLSSPFTGLIFTLDKTNSYARGPLHITLYILAYCYMFASLILLIISIKKEQLQEKKKQSLLLVALTVITLLSGVIQDLFNSLLVSFPTISLLILLIYLNIQNRQITTDVLT